MNNTQIVNNLKSGKIGIFPTDTAFGIGCRMDNVESITKIYKIRNRPEEKALLILVSSVKMAKEYAEISEDVIQKLINNYWPGGLTIILKCKEDMVPGIVRAEGETIAIRLPDHKQLREIIESLGVPIVAPSANFTGEQTPFEFSEIDKALLSEVDFIIEGVCTIKGVSTIIDTTQIPWRIVRQGVVELRI